MTGMTTTRTLEPEPLPSWRRLYLYGLLATGCIEGITLIFRFMLDLQSTRDTASSIGSWTGGIRIHHGYIGLVIFFLARLARQHPKVFFWLWVTGFALIASDLIHHFLVLWPLTGSPQFDLVYPT